MWRKKKKHQSKSTIENRRNKLRATKKKLKLYCGEKMTNQPSIISRHFDINFDLLFNNLSGSVKSNVNNFCYKYSQRRQLYNHHKQALFFFFTICHFTSGDLSVSFLTFQWKRERQVLFSSFLVEKLMFITAANPLSLPMCACVSVLSPK